MDPWTPTTFNVSSTPRKTSAAEARSYLDHPVLGPRLVECSEALLAHRGLSAREIFGGSDEAKLRSSMTLFAAVAPERPVFQQVLDRYFDGEGDRATLDWL
ncbi:MAG TPA: DUF1810 family protein [Solirubrobacterales bacterium]|nr:DUF1810 family protein [Solirubrobacterales bacterium]